MSSDEFDYDDRMGLLKEVIRRFERREYPLFPKEKIKNEDKKEVKEKCLQN